jgi:hypothetical protein
VDSGPRVCGETNPTPGGSRCQHSCIHGLARDATYARALARFGEQGISDLASVSGYYTFLAMVPNIARTTLPKGSAPARVSVFWTAMGLLISLSVGLFFGIYPAVKASNLDPVRCLRYE